MKKSFLIAGAALVALAVPAIAALHEGGPKMAMPDMTRADAEAKVKEHFAKADANKDGAITKEEAQAQRQAMRAERRDAHFKAMDKDGNGAISRAEFDAGHEGKARMADGMRHHRMGAGKRMGGRMFDRADADKDGKVTLAEATGTALSHFDKVDANKDGTVTAAERMEFWKNKKAEWRAGKADKAS